MYSIHKMRSLKYRLRHRLNCCDCGYFEVYMVTDEVWAAARPHWFAHCCMAYLERRFKQPLRIGDFTPRSIAWPMRLWEEYPSWPRRSDARRKRGGLFPCPAKSSCGSIFRMTMIRNASGRCDAALEAGLKVRVTMNIHYDRNASASKQTS